MTVSDLKYQFQQELSEVYSLSESVELFFIFSEHLLGFNKIQLRHKSTHALLHDDFQKFSMIIAQLKTGKPYQQIIGEAEFYGLKFFVDEHVLIPRPETEELVDYAIGKLKDSNIERFKMIDIGTGSGVIPIVLKKYFSDADIFAIDLSENALRIAQKNADFHGLKINFLQQDYLREGINGYYDVIISNPPYIGIDEEKDIADSVKNFEPTMALFAPDKNPLVFYEKIAEDCKNNLAENGWLFLEINQKLGQETLWLYQGILSEVKLMKDLSVNHRFIVGRK